MIKSASIVAISFAIMVSGCARTAVTPLAKNRILISTAAAPACGRTGAAKVALKMAAIETLRRGYTRFVITGAGSQSNVSAIATGPTYANTNTTGTFNRGFGGFGRTTYSGQSRTTYGGQGFTVFGTNDADLNVLMLKKGERYFSDGVDAKITLGVDWAELVENGVNTCGA